MPSEKHYFTDEFPDHDYPATTESKHEQTRLWPSYLSVDHDRLFLFERSKNAQLVVCYARYSDKSKHKLDSKNPLEMKWQSYGWTDHPTSNGTGMIERRLAWGYSSKVIQKDKDNGLEDVFEVSLNALPSRKGKLRFDSDQKLVLVVDIDSVESRLWKIYVQTDNSSAFIPQVLYVELYGTSLETGDDTYERINVADL